MMISDLLHHEAGIYLKDPAGMFVKVEMYLLLLKGLKKIGRKKGFVVSGHI